MPYPNRFKRALAAGQLQIGLWSTLASPYATEMLAGSGFDWMLLDTEHTPSDVPLMLQQLQALDAEPARHTAAVVRPAWNDPVLIKRYLDIGAQTLLLPFVQNADEARAAVAATRYAPQGVRGMGGSVRASRFGRDTAYAHEAAQELCVLVQVETADALAHIEGIAAVPGVDGIFIGPADLAASMGHAGQPGHPEVRAAVADAIRRIRAAGRAPGILVTDEGWARECIDHGALFVAVAIDMLLLRQSADAAAARFRPASADAVVESRY